MSADQNQYTIRGVSDRVDRALRDRSRREGISLNQLVLEALRSFVGGADAEEHHDLDDLAATWIDDPEVHAALEEQRLVEEDLWR